MLDVIRANAQSWGVKAAFGIIILVFVFWGIGSLKEGPSSVIVAVNKKPILYRDFARSYEREVEGLRSRFPGISSEELKQFGLKRQVLQQMVAETLLEQEAARIGMTISPAELRRSIDAIPAFRNGQGSFDAEQYRKVLQSQQTTPGRFEDGIRRDMLLQKLRDRISSAAVVTDTEAREVFDYGRERRVLEYVLFPLDEQLAGITIADEDVQAFYDARKETFKVPARVALEYVLINPATLASSFTVEEEAVAAYYKQHAAAKFQQPERVHARHILVMVPEGAPEADVAKARAHIDDALAQIKAGKDFGAVAAKFSQDGSAKQGGDLGWFTRGQMVAPFEEVAFSQKPGTVSEPVRTMFGFHLIKVETHEQARQASLEEVRPQIRKAIAEEKATERLHDTMDTALELVTSGKPVAEVAQQLKLERRTTEPFAREDGAKVAGLKPQALQLVFATPEGTVIDTPLETDGGFMVARVVSSQPESYKPVADVRTAIVTELKGQKATQKAREVAGEAVKTLGDGPLPAQLQAKVKVTEPVGRDGFIAGIGEAREVATAAFGAPVGTWLPAAYGVDAGALLVRVKEVRKPTDADWEAAATSLKSAMLNSRKEELYRAFLVTLSEKGKIEWRNPDLVGE